MAATVFPSDLPVLPRPCTMFAIHCLKSNEPPSASSPPPPPPPLLPPPFTKVQTVFNHLECNQNKLASHLLPAYGFLNGHLSPSASFVASAAPALLLPNFQCRARTLHHLLTHDANPKEALTGQVCKALQPTMIHQSHACSPNQSATDCA